MYRSYFGLQHKPFQISSDPKFLWLGEKHQEALAILKYGILDNRGFLLLTGDVGTGKTTLINALVNSLDPDTIVAHVPDPGLAEMDFFNYIASAFNMPERFDAKGEFLVHFKRFLEKAYTNRKQVLLIVDEAQRLGTSLLEEIRLLSNIELQQTKLINIFFVGQDEFNDILSKNENRALRQRMTLNYHIDPLAEEETRKFIRFRLKIAGTEKKIFTTAAMDEIHAFTGGYPRLINIICDHALLTGYVKGVKTVDAEIIAECAKELRLPKRQSVGRVVSDAPTVVALPLPARKPDPLPEEKRRSWVPVFFFLLLFIFVAAMFYPFKGGGLWASLHQGIDRLAYVITGESRYLGPLQASPEKVWPPPEETLPVASSFREDGVGTEGITPAPEDKMMAPVMEKHAGVPTPGFRSETLTPVVVPVSGETEADPLVAVLPPASAPDLSRKASPDIEEPVKTLADDSIGPIPEIAPRVMIRFGYNTNDLSPDAYEDLNQLAAYLKSTPTATIVISGHTDALGSYGYNLSLSKFRANIVKNYLLGHGISTHRMTARGLGSQNPLDTNDTAAGRNTNRRVEIDIQKP